MTQLQKYGTTATHSMLSGNRLIPIGGRQLHCEPPADFCQQRTGREERRRRRGKMHCVTVLVEVSCLPITILSSLNVFCI